MAGGRVAAVFVKLVPTFWDWNTHVQLKDLNSFAYERG
jgi:hypothetical protein